MCYAKSLMRWESIWHERGEVEVRTEVRTCCLSYPYISLIRGSPQDRLLTVQAEASERLSLPLICAPARRLISLEQWRGDNIHPPLDFCEHRREPCCPKEL